jgi:ribosome-binding factor A
MPTFRRERLGVLIQEKIAAMIVSGKIKDPRVGPFLSITRVDVSPDLAWADVYVSAFTEALVTEGEGTKKSKAIAGLESAAGFIQSTLARELHTRLTPKLRFHRDTGLAHEFNLIQKINALTENDASLAGTTPEIVAERVG